MSKRSSIDVQEQIVSLINQVTLIGCQLKDNIRIEKLRQIESLILNENRSLLDNFLEEILVLQSDRSVEIRCEIANFLEKACRCDPDVVTRLTDNLRYLLYDTNVNVVKRAICVSCHIYRIALKWLCSKISLRRSSAAATGAINDKIKNTWQNIRSIKEFIVNLLWTSKSDGVRIAVIRFLETICLVQSFSTESSATEIELYFCIDQLPCSASACSAPALLSRNELAREGATIFQTLLNYAQSSTISSINLIVCIQSICLIAAKRPDKMFQVVQTLEALESSFPTSYSPSQLQIVKKHLKAEIIHLLRLGGAALQYKQHLSSVLILLGVSEQEIETLLSTSSKLSTKRKRVASNHGNAAKTPRIDCEVNNSIDITTSDILTNMNINTVVDLCVASISNLPDRMPASFTSSYKPIEGPGSPGQISKLARMLAAQLTAARLGRGYELCERARIRTQELSNITIRANEGESISSAVGEKNQSASINPFPSPEKVQQDTLKARKKMAAKPFRLADVTSEMSYDDMNTMAKSAFQRIVSAEEIAKRYGACAVRRKIMTSLVCMSGQSYRDLYEKYIFRNLEGNLHLVFDWIYQEFSRMRTGESCEVDDRGSKYEDVLIRILDNLQEKPEYKDSFFDSILLITPHFPDAVLNAIVRYCSEDALRCSYGSATLKELLFTRKPSAPYFLNILLNLANNESSNADIRRCAISNLVSLYDECEETLLETIEQNALNSLRQLTNPISTEEEQDEDGTVEAEEEKEDSEHSLLIHQYHIKTDLFFAILPHRPSLIHQLAPHLYTQIKSNRTRELLKQSLIEPLHTITPNSFNLNQLIEDSTEATPSELALELLTHILSIITECEYLSEEHVSRIREIVNTSSTSKTNLKLLLATTLSSLSEVDAPQLLPLLLADEKQLQSSLERLYRNRNYSPANLLAQLNRTPIDSPQLLKNTMQAIGICFSNKKIFTEDVVKEAIVKMLDPDAPISVLLMRSIMQAVLAHKQLAPTIIELLDIFVNKTNLWQTPKLWDGFIKCCRLCRPHSFPVLLRLPGEQLANVIQNHSDIAFGIWSFLNDANLSARERQMVPPEIIQAICNLQNGFSPNIVPANPVSTNN